MASEIYYWDSSVFISFLNGEKDRVDIVNQILDEAEMGNVTIVTSFITITEVLCADEEKPRTMGEKQKQIIKRFFQKEYIEWIDFSRVIAEAARELCWNYGLKSKDAIHLASAQHIVTSEDVILDEVHSFDNHFIKNDQKIPGLRCRCCQPTPKQSVLLLGDARKKAIKKSPKK